MRAKALAEVDVALYEELRDSLTIGYVPLTHCGNFIAMNNVLGIEMPTHAPRVGHGGSWTQIENQIQQNGRQRGAEEWASQRWLIRLVSPFSTSFALGCIGLAFRSMCIEIPRAQEFA